MKINDDIMNADDLGRGVHKLHTDALTNSTIPGSLKRGIAFQTQSSGFNNTKYPVNLPKVPRQFKIEDQQLLQSAGFNSRNRALISSSTAQELGPGAYNIRDSVVFKS